MLDVLLALAAELSGYPMPAQAPSLEYRPREWLRAHVCADTRDCQVHGLYLDHGDVIYLDQRLEGETGPVARSIVLHELVHYLQDRAGQHGGGCAQRHARELEAYRLQQAYLQHQGLVATLRVARLPCAGEIPSAAQAKVVLQRTPPRLEGSSVPGGARTDPPRAHQAPRNTDR